MTDEELTNLVRENYNKVNKEYIKEQLEIAKKYQTQQRHRKELIEETLTEGHDYDGDNGT